MLTQLLYSVAIRMPARGGFYKALKLGARQLTLHAKFMPKKLLKSLPYIVIGFCAARIVLMKLTPNLYFFTPELEVW